MKGFAFEESGLEVGVADAGETPEVAKEGEVAGFGEVGGIREEAANAFAAIAVMVGSVEIAKGHGAVGELDFQLTEDLGEVGVVAMVHHNVAGIDGGANIGTVADSEGAGVSAEGFVFLKEMHLVAAAEEPCRGGAGYPAADYGDALFFGCGVHASGFRAKR